MQFHWGRRPSDKECAFRCRSFERCVAPRKFVRNQFGEFILSASDRTLLARKEAIGFFNLDLLINGLRGNLGQNGK
jgi:hypothetical protein